MRLLYDFIRGSEVRVAPKSSNNADTSELTSVAVYSTHTDRQTNDTNVLAVQTADLQQTTGGTEQEQQEQQVEQVDQLGSEVGTEDKGEKEGDVESGEPNYTNTNSELTTAVVDREQDEVDDTYTEEVCLYMYPVELLLLLLTESLN